MTSQVFANYLKNKLLIQHISLQINISSVLKIASVMERVKRLLPLSISAWTT
jgi:hypothetical protein